MDFWIAESKYYKQWLMIFYELKTRAIKDVLLTCCDNLKRISEALKVAFPNVHIQKCITHQIRNSTKHVSPKDVASFANDMKKIYKSPNYDAVLKALDSFEKSWGEKYPYAIKSWKNNFDESVTFFDIQQKLEKSSTQQTQ